MDDRKIIELFFARDESAISEAKEKYGSYCRAVAMRILDSAEDAAECENDTYLGAWNSIPPHRPRALSLFLAAITRRLSLDRLRKRYALHRGKGELPLSLCELEQCIPDGKSIDDALDTAHLARIISDFLRTLPKTQANVFLRRYWFFDSVSDIAARFGFSQSKVKMMLHRTRQKLLTELEKEDIFI